METLNAKLRNKVQPLHTVIELIEAYNNPDTNDAQKNVITKWLFNKKNIKTLKELESFLID